MKNEMQKITQMRKKYFKWEKNISNENDKKKLKWT